jgi:3-deoxy-D-manno-octulosonic-acid transferase
MHAVSVGEVGAAVAIMPHLESFMGGHDFALSVVTETGLEHARKLTNDRLRLFYAPVDVGWANKRALKMVKPDVLVLLETEIWPDLIVRAHLMGTAVIIVNGRISVRSVRRYLKIKSLMQYTLSHVDRFSMISEHDAQRIEALGARPDRITVNGNAKFDALGADTTPETKMEMYRLYNLTPETPVMVAGSTRSPEEQLLLDAYVRLRREFPELVMIIAPRHIQRAGQIERWVSERGMHCQRRSRLDPRDHPRSTPLVILDTIGELTATYALATFVYCGGSLVPKGGQNILEPAMWAKPVICGPSMEDFAEAHALIEKAGGCITVQDSESLSSVALEWLQRPGEALRIGQSARDAFDGHRGAAARHAAVINSYMQD